MAPKEWQPYRQPQSIFNSAPGDTPFDIPDMSAQYGTVEAHINAQRAQALLPSIRAEYAALDRPLPMELREPSLELPTRPSVDAMKAAVKEADAAELKRMSFSPRETVIAGITPEERHELVRYTWQEAIPWVEMGQVGISSRCITLARELENPDEHFPPVPGPNWALRSAVLAKIEGSARLCTWADMVGCFRYLAKLKNTLAQITQVMTTMEREGYLRRKEACSKSRGLMASTSESSSSNSATSDLATNDYQHITTPQSQPISTHHRHVYASLVIESSRSGSSDDHGMEKERSLPR